MTARRLSDANMMTDYKTKMQDYTKMREYTKTPERKLQLVKGMCKFS